MTKKKNYFIQSRRAILTNYKYLIAIFCLISLISVIKNTTMKILENIITIGENNCKYIDFSSYSNWDLILPSSSNPGNEKRYFYGIKKNDREFFNDTLFYTTLEVSNTPNSDNSRYEAEIFIVTINEGENKAKEYLVSIPKGNRLAEIYIFEGKIFNKINSISLLGNEVTNTWGAAFSYVFNGKNYALFGFKSTIGSDDAIIFKRFFFNSLEFNTENPSIITYNSSISISPSLSCFLTKSKYIICSFLT